MDWRDWARDLRDLAEQEECGSLWPSLAHNGGTGFRWGLLINLVSYF